MQAAAFGLLCIHDCRMAEYALRSVRKMEWLQGDQSPGYLWILPLSFTMSVMFTCLCQLI